MSIDREEAAKMLDACSKALAGHSSELHGAVLADLLSMWLAAHVCWNAPGEGHDPEATFKLREGLLNAHIREVVRLLPINEQIVMARYATQSADHHTKN